MHTTLAELITQCGGVTPKRVHVARRLEPYAFPAMLWAVGAYATITVAQLCVALAQP
jgi:hypothetical protein